MNIFLQVLPVIIGFLLDMLLGDPSGWPHPVRIIGGLISFCENKLRPLAKTDKELYMYGAILSVFVCLTSFLLPCAILMIAWYFNKFIYLAIASFFCYQLLAAKSLRDESLKVYNALALEDLPKARYALSRIVGRDTENLNETQITKAAVETVAENTSDGVIAPLLYLFLGVPFGFFYKAVNTLDSMIGYKNDKYMHFGRFAAKLDDVVNFIPSRISAVLILVSGAILGFDFKNGVKIWLRDRHNHLSPNSAQTEAVCAGLLRIQLAGNSYYKGRLVEKPTIGDEIRQIEPNDINLTNRIMYASSILGLIVFALMIIS